MSYDFRLAKDMARTLASRFGIGYINYVEHDGYYATTFQTANTIGTMTKTGKFSVWRGQMN